jgi:cytochrome c oxidase subunit II
MVNRAPFAATLLLLGACVVAGCSSGGTMTAVPSDVDLATVPETTVVITAENSHFTPDLVHVKAGTLVNLTIKSIEGTHGFVISEYGIDEEIEEGKSVTVRFYSRERGEIGFRCNHFCGLGHFGMNGKVLVE